MKKTWTLLLPITALIASCGGTTSSEPAQVYFSSVFSTIESTYTLTKTQEGEMWGNFSLEVALTRNGTTVNEMIYLYDTGLTTVRTGMQTIAGQLVDAVKTTTYDYASTNGGVFTQTVVASNPSLNTKVFTPFNSSSLNRITRLFDSVKTNLDTDIRAKINAQVTNLAIGGQLASNDLKIYQIPINEITTNYSKFSGVVGFTPTTVALRVEFRTSTNGVKVVFNSSATGQTYSGTFTLGSANTVNPSSYTLSLSDKQTFTGF